MNVHFNQYFRVVAPLSFRFKRGDSFAFSLCLPANCLEEFKTTEGYDFTLKFGAKNKLCFTATAPFLIYGDVTAAALNVDEEGNVLITLPLNIDSLALSDALGDDGALLLLSEFCLEGSGEMPVIKSSQTVDIMVDADIVRGDELAPDGNIPQYPTSEEVRGAVEAVSKAQVEAATAAQKVAEDKAAEATRQATIATEKAKMAEDAVKSTGENSAAAHVAKLAAETAKAGAESSATAAKTSEILAKSAAEITVENAGKAESAAETSGVESGAAKASALSAETSKNEAKKSEENASVANAAATTAQGVATQKAGEAAQSAALAKTSADAAEAANVESKKAEENSKSSASTAENAKKSIEGLTVEFSAEVKKAEIIVSEISADIEKGERLVAEIDGVVSAAEAARDAAEASKLAAKISENTAVTKATLASENAQAAGVAAEEAADSAAAASDSESRAQERAIESGEFAFTSKQYANDVLASKNAVKESEYNAASSAEYATSAAARAQNAADGAEDVLAISAKTDEANIFREPQTFNGGAIKNIPATTNTDVTNWSDVTRAVALSGIYNCSFRGMAKSAGTCASWINTADKILKLNPFATTQSYLAPNVSGFYALSSDCISVELPLRYYNFGEFSPVNGDNEICIKIRIVNRTGPMLYGISMTTDETQITWHPEHPKTIKTAPFTTNNELGVIHYWCKSSPLEGDIVGTEYCGLIEPDGTKQIFDATKAGHGWAYIDQRGVEDNFYIIIRRGFIEFWLRGFSGPGGREVSMSKYKPVFLGKVANFKSPGPTFGYRLFLTGYLPAAFDVDLKQRGGCSLESITIIREGNLSSVFSYQP